MSDSFIDRFLQLTIGTNESDETFRGCKACNLKTVVKLSPTEEQTLLKAATILKEKDESLSTNLKDFVQRRSQ